MKRWNVSHSNRGFELHVYQTPAWAVAISWLAEHMCVGPFHICHTPPVWRPWNWLACLDLRRANGRYLPLDDATARAMSPAGTWNYLDEEISS